MSVATKVSDHIQETGDRKIVVAGRIEWVGALLISAGVLFFIVMRTVHAGPLWRDECDSLQLATMPRFADLLEYLHFTGFPILFPVVVRAYTTLFGTTDIALRGFGLAVGLLFLGAAWFQSWNLNRKPPVLLPALIGLNLVFVTEGLWLRGYGLGSVLIVFAFAVTAKFLLQPNLPMLAAAGLAYLASMQVLYFNGVLVPAIVLAASVVLFIRHEWKWLCWLLGVALVSGLTYLPYIWRSRSSSISFGKVVQMPFSWNLLVSRFLAAGGGPSLIGGIAWRSIVLFCFVAGVWRLKVVWNKNGTLERDSLLFALLVIPLGVLAQSGFLLLLHNIIMRRYDLAIVTLMAAAMGLITANISWYYWRCCGRVVVVVLAMSMLLFAPWGKLGERNSNIDVVTQRVEKDAGPKDLIVVNDSQLGVSFNHYYRGPNHWVTVPELEDHRLHRYDLLQKKMMEFFPLDDLEKEISSTLKSGNRVWIVGQFGKPYVGSISTLAPAPDPEFGWQLPAYIIAWSQELRAFLRQHAGRVELVVPTGKSVYPGENPQLIACDGWKY